MLEIRELTLEAIFVRIIAAVLLGGILGVERGRKNRPAGFRTYILVCVGACVVMLTNQYIYQVYDSGDPVRMGAQVISGVGFLGAGTIVVTSRNQIRGLTTAAGMWAAACVGLAIGIGLYEVAVVGGVTIFLVLSALNRWDHTIRHTMRFAEVYIELDHGASLGNIVRDARERDIEISNIQLVHDGESFDDSPAMTVTLKGKKNCDHEAMVRTVRKLEGVLYVEEL